MEVDHELEKIKECDDVGYDIVAEWPRHYEKCFCDIACVDRTTNMTRRNYKAFICADTCCEDTTWWRKNMESFHKRNQMLSKLSKNSNCNNYHYYNYNHINNNFINKNYIYYNNDNNSVNHNSFNNNSVVRINTKIVR